MKPIAPAPLALAALLGLTAYAALAKATVSATREGQLLNATPAAAGVSKDSALREAKPAPGGLERWVDEHVK